MFSRWPHSVIIPSFMGVCICHVCTIAQMCLKMWYTLVYPPEMKWFLRVPYFHIAWRSYQTWPGEGVAASNFLYGVSLCIPCMPSKFPSFEVWETSWTSRNITCSIPPDSQNIPSMVLIFVFWYGYALWKTHWDDPPSTPLWLCLTRQIFRSNQSCPLGRSRAVRSLVPVWCSKLPLPPYALQKMMITMENDSQHGPFQNHSKFVPGLLGCYKTT